MGLSLRKIDIAGTESFHLQVDVDVVEERGGFLLLSFTIFVRTMATTAINDIVTTIGLDPGKNVFHIVGMNGRGAVVLRERLQSALASGTMI